MSEGREVRSLGVEEPGRLVIWAYEEGPLAQDAFRVETLYTGLSAGTELTFFNGTNPYLRAGWDEKLSVFREDAPGISYPVRFLGYMEVGRVVASRASGVGEGDVLAMTYGHKTGHTAESGEPFTPLPPDLDPLLGIYVAQMGPICANGLLHAAADARGPRPDLSLEDGVRERRVLVTGAGVVGLLTGLWARHLGATEVAVIDGTPTRLAAAERLGLTPLTDDGQASLHLKRRWSDERGAGADVVFQCRGQTSALATALRALRPQGTVIDLAFYQGGAPELRLGEEFHHNGLTIRSAQIARTPRGLDESWNHVRLAEETIRFLRARGGEIREHLVTDVIPFEEAPSFVADLANRKRHALQVVLEVNR